MEKVQGIQIITGLVFLGVILAVGFLHARAEFKK